MIGLVDSVAFVAIVGGLSWFGGISWIGQFVFFIGLIALVD